MSWAKLDDGIYKHPKLHACSVPARWLFIAAISFSRAEELDGYLEPGHVAFLVGSQGVKRSAVKELLDARLFDRGPDEGVVIHDYEDYNPPTSRERTRVWRQRQDPPGDTPRDVTVTSPVTSQPSHGDGHGDVTPRTRAGGNPDSRIPLSRSPSASPPLPPQGGGNGSEDPELPEQPPWQPLLDWWVEYNGGHLSPFDIQTAKGFWGEFQRLSAEEMVGACKGFVEWLASEQSPPLRKLMGCRETLRKLNDRRADDGYPPRGSSNRARSGGFAHMSDVELNQLQGVDQ